MKWEITYTTRVWKRCQQEICENSIKNVSGSFWVLLLETYNFVSVYINIIYKCACACVYVCTSRTKSRRETTVFARLSFPARSTYTLIMAYSGELDDIFHLTRSLCYNSGVCRSNFKSKRAVTPKTFRIHIKLSIRLE